MRTLTFLILLGSTALAQTTQRVSVGTNAFHGIVETPVRITPDGRYVAFTSFAPNLVPADTNGAYDVFLRDFQSGSTELVSVATGGAHANDRSGNPSITPDGRYVAFDSDATNLVAGDTNGWSDIFVRDRVNGTTELVSVGINGAPANFFSYSPSISSDGRYVAFRSPASNLVANDTNGTADIFVRDRLTGTTQLVSVATGGALGNSSSDDPAISADGRYVAFMSFASNLVPGDTNGKFDLFLRDRQLGTTERVNVATGGAQSDGDNFGGADIASISSDGRYVAFASYAPNLVANDTNGTADIFVRDRQLGTTALVSVNSSGVQGNFASVGVSISSDGRYVAFDSQADNLVPGDTNTNQDVFVRDLQLGTTERVSVSASGVQGNSGSASPSISTDGRYVAFASDASNLLPDDDSPWGPLRRDRELGITQLVQVTNIQGDSFSDQPSISADGRCVAFRTNASNLDPYHGGPSYDVFVYDRPSFSLGIASESTAHDPSNGPSYSPALSSDGRFVAFESEATNLVTVDTNNARDIFVHDCQQRTTERVSLAFDGAQANANSYNSAISGDGRFVAFRSDASNLVAGDTNLRQDIFVRDRQAGTTERVNVATGGAQGDGYSDYPSISADGRYVAFMSQATNLVPSDTNGAYDIFVHDRQTNSTVRVSVATAGTQSNGDSYGWPSISADGRYVAFASDASNLVAGDTNGSTDVFVHDRVSGTTERVSVTSNGAQAGGGGYAPSISADGRYVSFQSDSTELIPGDTNGKTDVFVHDRLTGVTERVSVATDGTQGITYSDAPSISRDGRFVAFRSDAWNLVPGDTNGWGDIFVRDRGAGSAFSTFCFGDGSGAACPCANNGNPGHGCQNSASTGGAVLTAAGGASLSLDTVALTSSSELSTSTSVVLQGVSAVSPAIFGDGLRCAGGTLKRLFTKHAVGGVMTAPQTGDPSISARSSALGDTIPLGATRIYQVYYRDANLGFCPGGFNITNAIAIAWGS